MATKHTPGPWRKSWFEQNKRTKCGYWAIHRSGPEPGFIGRINGNHRGKDQGEANAELIAAAPETARQRDALLAACKALIEICNARWRSQPVDTPEKRAMKLAYDAIASAEA